MEQIAGVVNGCFPTACRRTVGFELEQCAPDIYSAAPPPPFFLSRIPLTGGSRGKCSFCCIEHAALWPRKILQNPSSWDTYQVKLANIPQAGVRRTSGGGWRGAQQNTGKCIMKRKISGIMIHRAEASGKCSATWSHILTIPVGSESPLQNALFFFNQPWRPC